jgi:hypothetical protein
MLDIANIPLDIDQGQQPGNGAGKAVFVEFFNSYGTFWTSKFSTGVKDAQGRDKGVRMAMAAWDKALAKFDQATIEAGLHRWTSENTDKPPHLPQFLAACEVASKSMGRVPLVALPYEPPPRAEVSLEPVRDGKDWARKILAGINAGDKRTVTVRKMAMDALGTKSAGVAA